MKHKIIKIISFVAIILITFTNYNVFAINDPLENPNAYNPTTSARNEQALKEMTGKILGVINTFGIVISVIVLMVIGIKYMMGSTEEKAEYKKSMMGYVIGAILLFSVTTIANILYEFAQGI